MKSSPTSSRQYPYVTNITVTLMLHKLCIIEMILKLGIYSYVYCKFKIKPLKINSNNCTRRKENYWISKNWFLSYLSEFFLWPFFQRQQVFSWVYLLADRLCPFEICGCNLASALIGFWISYFADRQWDQGSTHQNRLVPENFEISGPRCTMAAGFSETRTTRHQYY